MVPCDLYMAVNAPTTAEGALQQAFWHGTPIGVTAVRSLEHAAQYGIPEEEYRTRIVSYIAPALESPEGLTALLRRNMWRSPGPQNVRAYLARDWETDLTPAQVLDVIRRFV